MNISETIDSSRTYIPFIYYSFGMVMEARNFSVQGKYRYGFNGKEKDDELGKDNYDFGARIYDGKIGRWLSVDPLFAKYPALTPFNYSFNSPLLFADHDGRDAVVKVQKNENGGGKIIITSITYITGANASCETADYLNQEVNALFRDGIYIDENGNKWEVEVSVTFEYIQDETAIKIGKGENILKLTDDATINSSVRQTIYADGSITSGNNGNINPSHFGFAGAVVVAHELLHMYGLSDRYDFKADGTSVIKDGWEFDIMAGYSNIRMSDVHFNNWGKSILETTKGESGEFVLDKVVDAKGDVKLKKVTPIGTIDKNSLDYLIGELGGHHSIPHWGLVGTDIIEKSKRGADRNFIDKSDMKWREKSLPDQSAFSRMNTYRNTFTDYQRTKLK